MQVGEASNELCCEETCAVGFECGPGLIFESSSLVRNEANCCLKTCALWTESECGAVAGWKLKRFRTNTSVGTLATCCDFSCKSKEPECAELHVNRQFLIEFTSTPDAATIESTCCMPLNMILVDTPYNCESFGCTCQGLIDCGWLNADAAVNNFPELQDEINRFEEAVDCKSSFSLWENLYRPKEQTRCPVKSQQIHPGAEYFWNDPTSDDHHVATRYSYRMNSMFSEEEKSWRDRSYSEWANKCDATYWSFTDSGGFFVDTKDDKFRKARHGYVRTDFKESGVSFSLKSKRRQYLHAAERRVDNSFQSDGILEDFWCELRGADIGRLGDGTITLELRPPHDVYMNTPCNLDYTRPLTMTECIHFGHKYGFKKMGDQYGFRYDFDTRNYGAGGLAGHQMGCTLSHWSGATNWNPYRGDMLDDRTHHMCVLTTTARA